MIVSGYNTNNNKVLDAVPREIALEEISLPLDATIKLAQLRSGKRKSLNLFIHRIDNNIEDRCPEFHV